MGKALGPTEPETERIVDVGIIEEMIEAAELGRTIPVDEYALELCGKAHDGRIKQANIQGMGKLPLVNIFQVFIRCL